MPKIKSKSFAWENAPDIKKIVISLKKQLNLNWINTKNIYCYRSINSSSRAFARIWGLSKIWQQTLHVQPTYIIEVLSEKFDKLSEKDKENVIVHELVHIPKNFSGSLIPHFRKLGKRNFFNKVNTLIKVKRNI